MRFPTSDSATAAPARVDDRPDAVPLLVLVAGVLRAAAAFIRLLVQTVLDAPTSIDPRHLQPRILDRDRQH